MDQLYSLFIEPFLYLPRQTLSGIGLPHINVPFIISTDADDVGVFAGSLRYLQLSADLLNSIFGGRATESSNQEPQSLQGVGAAEAVSLAWVPGRVTTPTREVRAGIEKLAIAHLLFVKDTVGSLTPTN